MSKGFFIVRLLFTSALCFTIVGVFQASAVSLNYYIETESQLQDQSRDSIDFNEMGSEFLQQGQYDSASYYLTQALKQHESDPDTYNVIENNLGVAYWQLGDYSKSLVFLEHAVKYWESNKQYEHLPAPLLNLSIVCDETGETNKAQDYIDLAEHYYYRTESDPSYLSYILNRKGAILNNDGQFVQALEAFRSAYNHSLTNLSADHPVFEWHYTNFAVVFPELGLLDSAKYYSIKSIDFIENIANNKSNLYFAHEALGSIYRKSGQVDKALKQYLKAADLAKVEYGLEHPTNINIYNSIGALLLENDKPEEALHYYELGKGICNSHVSDTEMEQGEDGLLGNRLLENYFGIVQAHKAIYLNSPRPQDYLEIEKLFDQLFSHLENRSFKARNEDDRSSLKVFDDILKSILNGCWPAILTGRRRLKRFFYSRNSTRDLN